MTRTILPLVLTLLAACDWSLQRMVEQQRCAPQQSTRLLPNGSCAQQPPEGTVRFRAAPGAATERKTGAELAAAGSAPIGRAPLSLAILRQGQRRFETFCSPCHGVTGYANTQVGENMSLRKPPSLHEARISNITDAEVFAAITQGYGLMPSYAHALHEDDRWAVVAYVRVLQRSQHVLLADLPQALQEEAQPWLR